MQCANVPRTACLTGVRQGQLASHHYLFSHERKRLRFSKVTCVRPILIRQTEHKFPCVSSDRLKGIPRLSFTPCILGLEPTAYDGGLWWPSASEACATWRHGRRKVKLSAALCQGEIFRLPSKHLACCNLTCILTSLLQKIEQEGLKIALRLVCRSQPLARLSLQRQCRNKTLSLRYGEKMSSVSDCSVYGSAATGQP